MINTVDTPKLTYPVTYYDIELKMPNMDDTNPIPSKKEAKDKCKS